MPPNLSSGEEALQTLMAGNMRYVGTKLTHPNQSAERRAEVAQGQHPFAVILGCSDSRVPPELIFDQGLGDLFVIRVAGNSANDVVLGSIEYAAEHLGVRLVMVLGHERCGAVEAAVKAGEVAGHIASVVEAIVPAVERIKGRPGDPVDHAVRANVELVVTQLKSSAPVLAALVQAGRLKIVGARYDLESGWVDLIA